MNEPGWLTLALLPLASWLGWQLAARYYRRGERRQRHNISSNYFRGLNYLLNEQPDKAIEVFLKLAEINQDTVETHLALGNLFRRRGEVDKAIRFHRHIMSRSSLGDEHRIQALLELGEDYMRAGLLDRAEKLFSDLAEQDRHSETAIRNLLSIYQQEKDWQRAIEQARKLGDVADVDTTTLISQFHCELAVEAWEAGARDSGRQHLEAARAIRDDCVRTWLIEGDFNASESRWSEAAICYRKACELDPDIAVLVIDSLSLCHARLGCEESLMTWLRELAERGQTVAPVLAFATIQSHSDVDAAIEFLLRELQRRPSARGLYHLLELMRVNKEPPGRLDPELVRNLMRRLLVDQPRFRCGQCGFSGQTWHWQCPSCRQWETTRPVIGVLGE